MDIVKLSKIVKHGDVMVDKNVYKLTDAGKIQWFEYRIAKLFYNPLIAIFTPGTDAHKALNQDANAFMMAAFSVLLNGIDSLGSFITNKTGNYDRFRTFMKNYMPNWVVCLEQKFGKTYYLPKILWKKFRVGLTHGFVIEDGCLDSRITPDRFRVENNEVVLHLELFVEDFKAAWTMYFKDIKTTNRDKFLRRFKEVYPE